MQKSSNTANAAIFFAPDGYNTNREHLMGRHVAGESFLKALTSASDTMYCYAKTQESYNFFNSLVGEFAAGKQIQTAFIPFAKTSQLRHAGNLYIPAPTVDEEAWIRSRFGHESYGICGVTHTTATDRVMRCFGNFLTAPVKEWDALICTSKSVLKTFQIITENYAEHLKQQMSLEKAPQARALTPIIPLGINCNEFDAGTNASKYRKQWRSELGIGDEFAALFVGRLSFHSKAHPFPIFKAMQLASEHTGKRLHLILAGWFVNEHVEAAYRSLAKNCAPNVVLHIVDGRTQRARKEIWHVADVFTSFSDNIQETFGLTPIEAMAAGLPIIASDWDGYRETIRHGTDGFLAKTIAPDSGTGGDLAFMFERGLVDYDNYCANASLASAVDIKECKQAFVDLIENPSLRKKMGAAAKQRALEVYNWEVVIQQYKDLWQEMESRRMDYIERNSIKPGQHTSSINPLRDDPFRIFAHYPTSELSLAAKISFPAWIQQQTAHIAYETLMKENAVSYGMIRSDSVCRQILDTMVMNDGVISASQLVNSFAITNRGHAKRNILMLAKFGLLEIQ